MKINKLNISSFGKFSNKSICFSDKINVIYGENESGKTTLLSFIRYMLYGLHGRKSVNNITFEEKYLPWNNTCLSGSMEFEKDNANYLLSRTNGVRKEVNTINVTTGEKVFEGVLPGEELFGVNESGFMRTYYLSGTTCAFGPDKNDDVIKSLTNLANTGDETLSYSAACSKINSDKKVFSEKLMCAENDIYTMRKKLERINVLKQRLAELEGKLNVKECTIDEPDKSDTDEHLQQLIEKQSLIRLYQQSKLIILILLFIVSVVMFVIGHYLLGSVTSTIDILSLVLLMRSKKKLRLITNKINSISDIKHNNSSNAYDKTSVYKEIGAIEAELENEFCYDDICSQIDCLEKDKQSYKYKIKVLEKAKFILDESYSQMKNIFSPLLNKRVTDIFLNLTCGQYSDILVSDDFSIQMMDKYDYKNSKMYSMSVIESLYLSLRLALCDILDGDDKLPIFLDDCFISYDDKKAGCAIDFLDKYAGDDRQVIICTCHKREFELLSKLDNVNIINLNLI